MMNEVKDIFKINETTTSLIDGEFKLDCPEMTLESIEPDNSHRYSGSGYIKENKNGSFEFKLFSRVLPVRMSGEPKEGEIIPDSAYYVLRATDLKNRRWSSKRIPFASIGWKGIVLSGALSTLYLEESLEESIQNPLIRIQILDDLAFPANSSTEYSIFHRDDALFKKMSMNFVEFESEGKKFSLLKHNKIINIIIVCQNNNCPQYFDSRVIEALQFITVRRIKKTIAERREDNKSRLRIQLIKDSTSFARSHPPIKYTSLDETRCIWRLFDRYLKYISTYDRNDWHPLSSRIANLIEGGSYSYFILALVLCVEIEGILKEEYSEIANPSNEFLNLIDDVKKHFREWKAPENKPVDKDLIKAVEDRIPGLLSMLDQSRSIDKLRYLSSLGVVTEDYVRAWQELRPMLAHAYDPDSKPTQEFLDEFFRTLVLFYQLIFNKIGYEGKYTDYGIHGWPFKNYPLK